MPSTYLSTSISSAAAVVPEVGRASIEQERLRGGASLNLPDEEIVRDATGSYRIDRRIPRAHEGARDAPWAPEHTYGDYLRGLDRSDATTLAVLHAAASLFRGAGYAAFDGETPAVTTQAALAAPYAHVTAPLRRLVDRWGLVVCEAVSNGREAPAWVRESLGELPELMRASSQRAAQLSSGSLDRVEAALLRDRLGEHFDAVVLEVRSGKARIQLTDPAVTASCPVPTDVQAGQTIAVTLTAADIPSGTVTFTAT